MLESDETSVFDWKAYLEIAVRRRWWALAPSFAIGIAAFCVAILWPAVYRSESLILVEQQKVPAKYVTPNVISDLNSRLQSMTEQILSRTRLESLIKQFDLYSGERTRTTMDVLVDRMRGDIAIELAPTGSGKEDQPTAFRIYFSAESPNVAQRVNGELTSLFIEKSLEARAQQSISTTGFLQSELEQARKDLAQQEEQLRQYKMRYLGELPQQEQSNLQILNSLQVQLQSSTDALGRAEQQKIYLESLRSEYQAIAQSSSSSVANPGSTTASSSDATLPALQKQLAELEAKYTPRHPDVLRLKQQIAKLRSEKTQTDTPSPESGHSQTASDQPAFAEVDSRLKAVEAEIANNKERAEKTRGQIEEVRGRLGVTPVREQQLAEVTRNYENSREHYQSLLQKELESELATNLEKRQEGEQFRILDPPSLPDKPYKPNRPMIVLGGWFFGLCLGVGSMALREFTDTTVNSEQRLRNSVRVTILARIPVFHSQRERRIQHLRSIAEVFSLSLLALVCLALAIYTYRMI